MKIQRQEHESSREFIIGQTPIIFNFMNRNERKEMGKRKRVNADATRYKPDTSSQLINFKFGPFAFIHAHTHAHFGDHLKRILTDLKLDVHVAVHFMLCHF